MFEKLHKNSYDFCPEGGEKIDDFNSRVNDVICDVIEKNLRGRIIVVTHPSIIQSAIRNALDIPAKNQYNTYIRTASASQISYYQEWASLVYAGFKPF